MLSPTSAINMGFFRYHVGETTVTALHDGIFRRPLEGLMRNASTEQMQQALAEAGLATDALTITFTPILIEHGGQLTLVDTGYGDLGSDTNGFMLDNLIAAGHSPHDVDNVVISHFHPDHINGLRRKDGSEVFPAARIFVPAAEWQFWMVDAPQQSDLPQALGDNIRNVQRVFAPITRKIHHFADRQEIVPGLTALAAPGHTPGHSAFSIDSAGKRLIVMSDICNHPALFVRHPEWSPTFDVLPELALATRKRFLGMVSAQKLQVAFFHAPFPATGFIDVAQNYFRFIPVASV